MIKMGIGALDMIYPIGSIYLSVNNVSPSSLFGGIWEQIKDRFLLACGDTYINGSMGGEASHILSVDEMPKHFHKICYPNNAGPYETPYISYPEPSGIKKTWGATLVTTEEIGGNQSHNNMPPYLSIYVWKRTA